MILWKPRECLPCVSLTDCDLLWVGATSTTSHESPHNLRDRWFSRHNDFDNLLPRFPAKWESPVADSAAIKRISNNPHVREDVLDPLPKKCPLPWFGVIWTRAIIEHLAQHHVTPEEIVPSALKELKEIEVFYRRQIAEEIDRQLPHQPATPTRNRKILENPSASFEFVPPLWELRVGDFRVFYDIDDIDEDGMIVRIRAVRAKPPHATSENVL